MSQTGEPTQKRARLGPDGESTATSALQAVGSDCTERIFDEHKKRASTAMEDTLSDRRLNAKEMGNKRIKHLQETGDKAATAKAAAGAAGEDNDRDTAAAPDQGTFEVLDPDRMAKGMHHIRCRDCFTEEPLFQCRQCMWLVCDNHYGGGFTDWRCWDCMEEPDSPTPSDGMGKG